MTGRGRPAVASACALTLLCAGCAGGTALPSLPAAPSLGDLTVSSISSEPSTVPLSSTEAYSRIARGAMACWTGGRGRLARTHIFYADAAPLPTGGEVEIVVHERAQDQPKPWGYRAFRIVLTRLPSMTGAADEPGRTVIAIENLRLAPDQASRMREEVFRWLAGTEGCKADPSDVVAAPPPPPDTGKPKAKATKRASATSAVPN